MSSLATPIQQALTARPQQFNVHRANGERLPAEEVVALCKERRQQGKRDRSRYEPDWYLCQSYLANKQWVGWSPQLQRVLSLLEDPREAEREHHTENVISNYYWTAVGALAAEDYEPTLFPRMDGIQGEKVADQSRHALRFTWDEELDADEILFDIFMKTVAFGTAFGRCFFQHGTGPSYGEFPVHHETGQPITDYTQGIAYTDQMREAGYGVDYQELRGELVWEPLGPFNALTPPGVERMRNFPWLILESPKPVESLKMMFPERASEIQPQELAAIDMIGLREMIDTSNRGVASTARLKDHALFSSMYEWPTSRFPNGRVVMWTGETLLAEVPEFGYTVAGKPHTGVVDFHFRRVPGRYWSLGLVEPAIGVQRQRNRARSQHIEMKDRMSLGRIFAVAGTITQVNKPRGRIGEIIEIQPGHQFPTETNGVAPNQGLREEVEMLDAAMDRVTGFGRFSALSQPPPGVSAYSALALTKEEDDRRNGPIIASWRRSIARLVEVQLEGMRRYWPAHKEMWLRGEEGQFSAMTFEKATMPSAFYVEIGKGNPNPTSPAAKIQLVFDLFDRSISSGQPLPLQWLKDSIEQGEPQPLPHQYDDLQSDKAEYENLLLAAGQIPPVAPYDNDQLHVQIHRQDQEMRALDPSNQQVVAGFEEHIQEHLQSAMGKAAGANAPALQGPAGALGGGAPSAAPGLPQSAEDLHFALQDGQRAVRYENRQSPQPPGVR